MKFIHWIKEHPLLTALLVGVGILLILVMNSGSRSNSSGAVAGYAGPSDASINAAAALQAKAYDAQVAQYSLDAGITGKQLDNATSLALASMSADIQKYTVASQTQLGLTGIAAQSQVQLAGIAGQTTLADLNYRTEMARIGSNLDLAQITANTYQAITNAQMNRDIASINAQAAVAIAPYATVQSLYQTLGSDNLTKLIYGAEGTKGSTLLLPGISAGRVGSAGGTLFGNQFGDSSAGTMIARVAQSISGYGFQTGAFGSRLGIGY